MTAGTAAAPRRIRLAMPRADRLVPVVFLALAVVGLITFVVAVLAGSFDPGSRTGMGFGIAAAGALLLVMGYSVRRAVPAVRSLGPTRHYLQIHIYGGLLFMLLMLFHTGFGLPAGPLVTFLWVLGIWVVLSGLAGVGIQKAVPRLLDATSSFEVNAQRIPELVDDLRIRAQALANSAGSAVQSYYARELAPDMAEPRAALTSLLGRNRIASYRAQEFAILRRTLPAEAGPRLDELFQLHGTKLEMDLHFTLQRLLRVWLYFHLPVSVVLIGLVVLHVFFVLYF